MDPCEIRIVSRTSSQCGEGTEKELITRFIEKVDYHSPTLPEEDYVSLRAKIQ